MFFAKISDARYDLSRYLSVLHPYAGTRNDHGPRAGKPSWGHRRSL